MTHDPYQTYPTVGAYSGLTNPFSSPYGAMQTSAFNPAAGNPLAANAAAAWGIPGTFGQQAGPQGYGGISPQQLQLASALASQAAQMLGLSPFTGGWQNPLAFQNQLGMLPQQNPLLNQVLNPLLNPLSNPVLAQLAYGQPYQQHQQQPYQQQPYQQMGQAVSPFGQQQFSPFSQFNNPYAQPMLAPQSWVGQGQIGQPGQLGGGQGQIHPVLLQSIARAIQQSQGITPWGTF
jgi:hypothetical protein